MAKTYKVWIELEECDEERDACQTLDLPFADEAEFDTLEEAERYAQMMHDGAGPPPLSPQQRATILAALRWWQCNGDMADLRGESILDIATNGGEFGLMPVDEIDQLCERINQ